MTTFFEHQKYSFKRNYLRNLFQLASADGHLDENELAILYSIGVQRKLKCWQIAEILQDDSFFEVFIPESFHNRMNLLFDLMRLLYADGIVDDLEVAYIKNVLSLFSLSPSVTVELLFLFKNGPPSYETWREFTQSLTLEIPDPEFLTIL
jgi:hypothetical protein